MPCRGPCLGGRSCAYEFRRGLLFAEVGTIAKSAVVQARSIAGGAIQAQIPRWWGPRGPECPQTRAGQLFGHTACRQESVRRRAGNRGARAAEHGFAGIEGRAAPRAHRLTRPYGAPGKQR